MLIILATCLLTLGAAAPPPSSSVVSLSLVSSARAPASTVKPVVPVQPIVSYAPPAASTEAPVTRIFRYDSGGFENLAFRSNGQLLATIAFPEALLFYIDPIQIRPGIVLHNFTSLKNTLGITELAHDVFYVSGQAASGRDYTIFSVDMRSVVVLPDGTVFTAPVIKELGSIDGELNGMTHIRKGDNFILTADSANGGVWKFHVDTGKSELVIQDPSMKGPPNATEIAALGINGLRIQNDTLFYCNSGTESFYKMLLHQDGTSASAAYLITHGISCDDFALDSWGFAYVASPSNALIRLDTRTGAQLVVAGTFNNSASSDIVSASSVRFGVGDSDRSSAYVTTNGGAFVGASAGSQGVSRVDLGDLAEVFETREG